MDLCVVPSSSGHRLSGDAGDVGAANRFLEHLSVRNFSQATRRAYAYDLLNFLRFCSGRALTGRDQGGSRGGGGASGHGGPGCA